MAYLHWIRNVQKGLVTRTEILQILSKQEGQRASEIAAKVRVTSGTVLYHLRNMQRESIVEQDEEGKWRLGPVEQTPLTEFFKPRRRKKSKRK